MNRIETHANDWHKYGVSEYDLDPDLRVKPSAYKVAFKRSYAGNVRGSHEGYRVKRAVGMNREVKTVMGRKSSKARKWQLLKMNQEHHKAEMARRAEKPKRTDGYKNGKAKRKDFAARQKAARMAKRGGR